MRLHFGDCAVLRSMNCTLSFALAMTTLVWSDMDSLTPDQIEFVALLVLLTVAGTG